MKALQKYVIVLLALFFAAESSQGQEKTEKFEVGATYHYGFLWSHRNNLNVLVKDYLRSFELSFYKQFSGEEDWEQKYRHPLLGGSFMYFDFGNPQEMGYGYALFAFYDFPLAGNTNNSLVFRLGLGPGYVTKIFDRNDNIKNYGLSTKLNGFAQIGVKGKFRLYKGLKAQVGLYISHFSNASYKKPNLGINLPSLNAGLSYGFKEVELVPKKERSAYDFDRKFHHDVLFNYGMKEKNPIGGELYDVYNITYNYSRKVTFKSRVGAGLDFFYNAALKGEIDGNGEVIESTSDIMQWGIAAIYALDVSRFSVIFSPGYYIYTPYEEDGRIYSRFAGRYLIADHYYVSIGMKTHFAVADHVEYGIGYRF